MKPDDIFVQWSMCTQHGVALARQFKGSSVDSRMNWETACLNLLWLVSSVSMHGACHYDSAPVVVFLCSQAKSDTIDCLEPYRDKSIPTFLLFAVSNNTSVHLHVIGMVKTRSS